MIFINWLVLSRTMRISPLQFLRHDLSRHANRKHALPLPSALPFFGRFRTRVILQNLGSYVVLFVGVLFANLLLSFGMILPDALNHYSDTITDNMLSNTQTMLQIPYSAMDEDRKLNALLSMLQFCMETDTEENNAEKFSAYSLQTLGTDEGGAAKSESVLLYGVEPDSRYVQLPGDGVYLSSAYADKYELGAGDTITLREKYEDTTYTFTVDGVYDYMGALAVFMPREKLNEVFDLGDGYYGGYFSDAPLTEIKDEYVGSVIDLDQLTKVSRQLMVSMGASMGLVNGFAVMIFFVVVYLLSKMIIEKNAQSISMTKILGYNGSEVAGCICVHHGGGRAVLGHQPADRSIRDEVPFPRCHDGKHDRLDRDVGLAHAVPAHAGGGPGYLRGGGGTGVPPHHPHADGRSAEECGVMGYEKNDTDTFVCGAAAFGLRPGGRHGGNHLGGRPCCRDRDDGADLCPQDHARRRG